MSVQKKVYKIAVCDDEPEEREQIVRAAKRILQEERIPAEIFSCSEGKELSDVIHQERSFDLLLLDVMMPGQGGIELAGFLRGSDFRGEIIFISNNREMAMYGYQVEAARYLGKPLEEEHLREALLYCLRHKRKPKNLQIPVAGGVQRIELSRIVYIETQGRGSRIVQTDTETEVKIKISQLEETLSEQEFIRCHQGFLVNLHFVHIVHANELVLKNGEKIPVSKHRIQEVRKAFFSYLEE